MTEKELQKEIVQSFARLAQESKIQFIRIPYQRAILVRGLVALSLAIYLSEIVFSTLYEFMKRNRYFFPDHFDHLIT